MTYGKGNKKRNILEEERTEYRAEKEIQALLTSELLQTISGTTQEKIEELLRKYDGNLSRLMRCTRKEMQETGLTRTQTTKIMAAFELSKRIAGYTDDQRPSIHTPSDVARLLMNEMRYYKKEVFKVLLLDTKNRLLKIETISSGILDASLVHPREVFYAAIQEMASSVILVHNHPSGNIIPSAQDIEITKTMLEAGKIMNIEVIDHIIIGEGKFISLKEKRII